MHYCKLLTMFIFSNEEYADMHFIYGLCNGSGRAAVTEYRRRYPNRRIPDHRVFGRIHMCLRNTGSFPKAAVNRPPAADLEDVILDRVERSPSTSVRRIAQRIDTSRMKVWRTLHNFGLYPFHLQPVQTLLPTDPGQRMQFCQWLMEHPNLASQILFSDECTFTRDGGNNLRNSHSWQLENPHAITETNSQHRFSVNVWCGLVRDQLVGPFVINGRLTSQIYLNFLQQELPVLLEDVPLQTRGDIWFQHDGAPPHSGRVIIDYLNINFPGRWIGRGGPVPWPPRSPDLNPLDY